MQSIVVVGGQWGDEGKGKVVDLLAARANHVVRAQGGANAGHTVVIGEREFKLHLIPSGILHKQTQCYLAAGVVVDPVALVEEIKTLERADIEVLDRLWLSERAHLVLPYHRKLDALIEQAKDNQALGTTGRGIGPCLADKANRRGFRLADLNHSDHFVSRLRKAVNETNRMITLLYEAEPLNPETVVEECMECTAPLVNRIVNVEERIQVARQRNERIILEGAQGSLLDIDFGTYPYVTSSHTHAAGICAGAGWSPAHPLHILGVFKAFCTRVGEGPFPTEAPGIISRDLQTIREVGTTTGRDRRIGWFDAVLAKQVVQFNGISSLALTKLDVLDALPELSVCVAYKQNGRICEQSPCTEMAWEEIEPVYHTFPGWQQPTDHIRTFDALPQEAKDYVEALAQWMGIPVSVLSVGPSRQQTIFLAPQLLQEVV